jgi:drug/metabolite transporter (DMT)-like permease
MPLPSSADGSPRPSAPSPTFVYGAAALCCLLWSGAYVTGKVCIGTPDAPGLGPFRAAFLRFALAGVLLAAWGFWRDPASMRIQRADWGALGRLALLGMCLTYVFNYAGIGLSSGTAAALIMATAPVFVVLISVVFGGEKLTRRRAFGCAAGLTGALLVVTTTQKAGAATSGANPLLGNVLIVLSLLWESSAVLTVKHLTRRYKGRAVVTYEFLLGSVLLAPFALWEQVTAPHVAPTPAAWAAFAYLVVGCTLVAYTLWFRLMEVADASEIVLFIFMQPVIGTLLGVLVEHTALTWRTGVGALLVFVGVAGLALRPRRGRLPRKITSATTRKTASKTGQPVE